MNGRFASQSNNEGSVDLIQSNLVTLEYLDENPLHPKFPIVIALLDRLSGPWKHSLVIKVLGKSIGYKTLSNKAEKLRKPKWIMPMLDLSYDVFLVKFDLEEDLNYCHHKWALDSSRLLSNSAKMDTRL